ncbi:hypothetical protein QF031_002148 [Pseudarthrobacter defluvii]|nr:hypothetical protein [Pseudarthrobacter defluvii]
MRVDNVHACRLRMPRVAFGFDRITHVAGRECSSSPTLGTQSPSSEGVFALSVSTKLWPVDSDGGSRPWPGRRGGLFRCVGGGLSALAGGLTACCLWVAGGSSFRFCRVGLGWPTPVHGFAVRERHDEDLSGAERSRKAALGCAGGRGRVFVRPREVWTVSTATSASWSGRRGRVHCPVQGYEFISAASEKKQTEPSRTLHTTARRQVGVCPTWLTSMPAAGCLFVVGCTAQPARPGGLYADDAVGCPT